MNAGALTPEQERFANHDAEAFVEACPGAGKTRTVVARLSKITETLPPRRGVAILSFTNSAVEEFTKRSREAGVDPLLRYPSFVGTFDAFVRHFLVLPFGIAAGAARPIIVDSWERIGLAKIRLSGKKSFTGPGVSLDVFDAETNAVDPARIGHIALRQHVIKHQADYERAAANRRRFLHRLGNLSAIDARVEARRHFQNPAWNQALGRALAARFHEVIVDEAQDCNPLDLEILSWLRSHGLRVTVVCDPDQAIYGFRHGKPSELQAFGEKYSPENQLGLTGNFRCSGPICSLAATLRSRQNPDTPLGETADITHPVIVVTYSGRAVPPDIGSLFIERLEAKAVGLSRADGIVVSHALGAAQHATGDPMSQKISGTSRIEIFARAVGEFWSPSATSRSRDSALRTVEKLLLHLMGHWQDGDLHPSRVVERAGLDRRQLRRQALEVVMCLPKTCDDTDNNRSAWVASVQSEVERLRLVLSQGKTVPGYFRNPTKSQWSKHLKSPVVTGLSCSTIHEAKGRQYEAVCVVLQPDRTPDNRTSLLFDAWENRTALEAKRVIYVGVTRARRLVVLAVPESFADRCVAILNHGKVPYERLQQVGMPTRARR